MKKLFDKAEKDDLFGALLHGAKVSVDSAPGQGTRVEMQFPKKN